MNDTVPMNPCPRCHRSHRQVKDGFTRAGSQPMLCRLCNRRYTPQPKLRGACDDLKATALRMYVDGMNFRRIARHLDVHHQTVINWITAAPECVLRSPVPETTETVELDYFSLHWGKKTVVYVVTAVDRATHCVVGRSWRKLEPHPNCKRW